MQRIKRIILLTNLIVLALFSVACGKYDDAKTLFTEFDAMHEGDFSLTGMVYVSEGDKNMKTELSYSGVTDGSIAAGEFRCTTKGSDGAEPISVEEDLVVAENVTNADAAIKSALYIACGSEWKRDGGEYHCGTNDNAVAGRYLDFVAASFSELSRDDIADEITNFSEDVKQESCQVVLNTTVGIKNKRFSETVSGTAVINDSKTVEFFLSYSLDNKSPSLDTEEKYVTLEKALRSCYEDGYVVVAENVGFKEKKEQEITSHVIDDRSLLFEGVDEKFYVASWDSSVLSYDTGAFDYGEWSLKCTYNEESGVGFRLYENTTESLIEWYETTYDDMEVTYEIEKVTIGETTVDHVELHLIDQYDYVNDMYLYQVNDTFLVMITLTNNGPLTDEEMLNAALVNIKEYK